MNISPRVHEEEYIFNKHLNTSGLLYTPIEQRLYYHPDKNNE